MMNNKNIGHIMIVDDEDIVRLLLCDMVKNFGYSVTDFSDPMEAIDFYENNHESVDLVLLDMIMPKLSGRETFFLLKKINGDIKSIVLSGFSLNEDIEKMLKDGCLFHLKKPVKIIELKNAINKIMTLHTEDFQNTCETNGIIDHFLIDEADIGEALNNLGGNVDLYLKMLDKFSVNYKDSASKIKELATSSNYEDLFVLSHSIKSVAASLGFSKLKTISENIEAACQKKETAVIAENVDLFYDEMISISKNINHFIDEHHKKNNCDEIPANSLDNCNYKKVAESLDKLIGYARRSRPRQISDLFNDKLKNVTLKEFGYLEKEELLKKIKLYDFEGIVNCAEKIKNRFKDTNEQKI
jgi:CheY-like chemotaxis protein/HPt (histidine-containing phosphotransfer) domain-containing protein